MNHLSILLLPIGGKKEKRSYETLKNMSNTVVKSVKKFEEGVKAYSQQEFERGEKLLNEVDELESKADKYGFEFESELGEGAFLPSFRGDLSKLSESIDDIADMAEKSIREISWRPTFFEEIEEVGKENEEVRILRSNLIELAERAVVTTQALDKAVSILMENMDESAKAAERVHKKEHESDTKEDELSRNLYKYSNLLDPITVMEVRRIIDKFGAISDAAEASGNVLTAMTSALKA